jgi:hypothetical protein
MQSPRRYQPSATTSTQGPPTPAKPIDLNSSTATTDRATLTKVTRRAFLIDVVVDSTSTSEGESWVMCHVSKGLGRLLLNMTRPGVISVDNLLETSSLLVDLGNPLAYPLSTQSEGSGTPSRPSTPDPSAGSSAAWTAEKHAPAKEQFRFLRDELLKTERSYVQRVRALKGVSFWRGLRDIKLTQPAELCRSSTSLRQIPGNPDNPFIRSKDAVRKY